MASQIIMLEHKILYRRRFCCLFTTFVFIKFVALFFERIRCENVSSVADFIFLATFRIIYHLNSKSKYDFYDASFISLIVWKIVTHIVVCFSKNKIFNYIVFYFSREFLFFISVNFPPINRTFA